MNGKPVYQLSLKDSAGLIKLYAFVDALNYQRVGIGETLPAAWRSYTGGESYIPTEQETPAAETETVTGTIALLEEVVLAGETTYYFTLEGQEDMIYIAKVSLNDQLPFLQPGQSVTMDVQGNIVVELTIE